ncbi:MAG: hypothetical protein CVU39_23715 [Chloroflexi bacterium HGW-Chloroflexi-10]|nr:MAG: hypothetical protein CVU39_23715 [Chloroflexi bacterium HGW-Chloroflexi-10]
MNEPSNQRIITELAIDVLIRPIDQPTLDFQPFDKGPGYIDIPAGYVAEITIQNIHDETLRTLIEEIRDVDNIVSLNLSENRNLGNAGMRWVKDMTQLYSLNLSACGLNDRGLDPILQMRHLKRLDLSYCVRLTDVGIKKLTVMRNLEELDLHGIPKITNAGIRWVERHSLTIRT